MNRPQSTGTMTRKGLIPHLRIGSMDYPVALKIPSNVTDIPEAATERGALLYVVPGGGMWTAEQIGVLFP